MHVFFNDPRVAYVTRHRRVVRHPLLALIAGGVGVAALGVAIGSAGWEPPRHGGGAGAQGEVPRGMVTPDPVREIHLYDVPAAPQPVLGPTGSPARVLAGPRAPGPVKAPVRRIEKTTTGPVSRPATAQPPTEPTTSPTPEPTASPTGSPTDSPTASPTVEPTVDPTQEPTAGPASEAPVMEPTAWRPGWHHHEGRGHWPWERTPPTP